MIEQQPCDIAFLQEQIARKRDERCYKRLFFHFYKPLLRFALSYIKCTETAEEIVSDVMMKVWTMKEDLAAINNLKVYLYRSVKNGCLNHISKSNKYPVTDIENTDVVLNTDLYNPEEVALKNELRNKILTAIKELPPKCQMVYKLVREDGLTYREVAVVMNISENTVDRHLNNALHKLIKAVKLYLH
jgi:RNA polymerase sigma-70 factor (family 1)